MKNFIENISKNTRKNLVKNQMLKWASKKGKALCGKKVKLNEEFSPTEYNFSPFFLFVHSLPFGFILVELLVVIAIIGMLIALPFSAVQTAWEATKRALRTNHPKQIAISVHNFTIPDRSWVI
ncbi:MAG: prepilin-type N-terminal cleavage/methylation domain-containing protein [Planctomycetaceae bacterium]|jgi:type II secretory pathway pseudopilin PulG|nr:prepilin-type N-terminal cleavage/methylation domain-containing protein [Planctomycetaceae bacterium]